MPSSVTRRKVKCGASVAAVSACLVIVQGAAPLTAAAQDAGPIDAALKAQQDQIALLKAEQELQKLALERAELARALSEAKQKAEIEAFPKGDTTGKVDVKSAAQAEANALAAVATNAIADDIAYEAWIAARASANSAGQLEDPPACERLKALHDLDEQIKAKTEVAPVLLLTATDSLSFGHWEQFRFRACSIAHAFGEANTAADELNPAPAEQQLAEDSEKGGNPAAIGAALTIGTKLAQLVTPDWEFGAVSVSPSDRALMTAVAREYLRLEQPRGKIYWTGQISKAGGSVDVFGALAELDGLDLAAAERLAELEPERKKRQEAYDDAVEAKNKILIKTTKAALDAWSKPMEALSTARLAYDKLLKDLNGKDGEAVLPVNQVIAQAAAAKLLGKSGLALSLSMQSAGGGYYTRRVIWNALLPLRAPYWVSGGVVVNFLTIRPTDQVVHGAGLFACDSGYVQIKAAKHRVNAGGYPPLLNCTQSSREKVNPAPFPAHAGGDSHE